MISPERGYVFHNRLTHSLKVGQIARRLAEKLVRDQPYESEDAGLDPDSAEAVGLAHDLGHPPFGHIAETELDTLVRDAGLGDGYEGNAQSFRIVTRIASSDAFALDGDSIEGLNLTRRTLDGILKYPWTHGANPATPGKWGCYDSEGQIFEHVRDGRPPMRRSISAEIMDWADDLTYAVHDLLDFYCAGMIPIDRCRDGQSAERERLLRGMFRRKPEWQSKAVYYEWALDHIVTAFPFEPDERYSDSAQHRARLFAFSTMLIRNSIAAFQIGRQPDGGLIVVINEKWRWVVDVLKQFTWEYVIESPDLAAQQSGQRFAVRNVFQTLLRAAKEMRHHLLPSSYQQASAECAEDGARVRLVAGCVSGMTEKGLLPFHRSLQGLNG